MRYLCRLIGVLSLAALLLMCLLGTAWARFVPKVGVQAQNDGSAFVLVNGRKAIGLRTPNGHLSPAQRAKITADRLIALLDQGYEQDAVWVKQTTGSARVMVGESVLLIATQDEATRAGMASKSLAQVWVRNLKSLLSLPPLKASPDVLLIPLSESRSIHVESLLPDPVQAEVYNPSVIKVDGKAQPGNLAITGLSVGEANVTVKCGEFKQVVPIVVKKYAAYPKPEVPRAVVSGWNPPTVLMEQAIEDAARHAVSLEPGAVIKSIAPSSVMQDLAPGKVAQTLVHVTAAGGDYIPADLAIKVDVENQVLPPSKTSQLMYSNDPERVSRYQVLYTGKISQELESIRLLYHHQNTMGRRIGFVVDVLNRSSADATLHIIEGVSMPMVDTVIVGFKAGLDFMDRSRTNVGRIVRIPGGSRRVLISQALDATSTASGILEFRQLSGDPVYVRVISEPEEQRVGTDIKDSVIPANGLSDAVIVMSDHVYPNPLQTIDCTYTAGKPWVFLRIGNDPLKHATQDRQLYGNYGVTYDIKVKLENPGDQPHTAELAFEATAGPVSGVFYVDGELVRVRFLQSPQEATLRKITLPPGATRTVSIRTMPLSGSAYPATIIIRPAGTMGAMYSDSKKKQNP